MVRSVPADTAPICSKAIFPSEMAGSYHLWDSPKVLWTLVRRAWPCSQQRMGPA